MTAFLNYGVREEERKKTLDDMVLHDLRKIGRAVGVKSPTTQQKPDLIASILDVEYGRTPPTNSRRGRHPKSQELPTPETQEAADGKRPAVSRTVRGIATLLSDGCAILTAEWLSQETGPVAFTPAENVKVPAGVALESNMRTGDLVVGVARTDESGAVSLYSVGSVNGRPLDEAKNRVRIQSAFGGYPHKNFHLSEHSPSLRALDLFSPLGQGARCIAVTPSQTETEGILHEMLKGFSAQSKHVFVLFNEEYPEDAAEFCEDLTVTPVLLEYGKPAPLRMASIRLLFEHCKRLAEGGDNAILVIPSLTKLVLTASEAAGHTALCPADYQLAKEIFGSACNLTGGGSFTVVMGSVLSPADDVAGAAYRELSVAANMQYALIRKEGKLTVDFDRTFTKKAENLLSAYEYNLQQELKARAYRGDLSFFSDLSQAKTLEEIFGEPRKEQEE